VFKIVFEAFYNRFEKVNPWFGGLNFENGKEFWEEFYLGFKPNNNESLGC
jgi:hypothetical protein